MIATHFKTHKSSRKLVLLTAYTADIARIIHPHTDAVLVGDSLGMVLYGFSSTTEVTLPMMIAHGKAVCHACPPEKVIIDMPYGSVEHGKEQALENCQKVLDKTGAAAVKIEGGQAMKETIAYITSHGIPVMGHIGMMPQKALEFGGFKVQGKTQAQAQTIREDALAVEQAGVFAVVIEAVPEPLAREITSLLTIPTIGIGASSACDGQVLVTEDMAGLTGTSFKFVRRFGELGHMLESAASAYAQAVRSGQFPAAAECYYTLPVEERVHNQ